MLLSWCAQLFNTIIEILLHKVSAGKYYCVVLWLCQQSLCNHIAGDRDCFGLDLLLSLLTCYCILQVLILHT